MYTKVIPHKNFKDQVRNQTVHFNLTEHEFFKLLVEFKAIFDWQDRLSKMDDPDGVPDTAEVIHYYTNLEEILLSAWGELDESGDHFRKAGRYEFAESSLFHAAMKMFVEDPAEANKLVEGLMPPGLKDMLEKMDANTIAAISNPETPEDLRKEIERLRALEASTMVSEASAKLPE